MLIKIRDIVAEQWFRFQIGMSILAMVNFSLLVIALSDKLQAYFPIKLSELIMILIPLGFVGTWFVGLVMDKYIKFYHEQQRNVEKRSPNWVETHKKLDLIMDKLEIRRDVDGK